MRSIFPLRRGVGVQFPVAQILACNIPFGSFEVQGAILFRGTASTSFHQIDHVPQ